MGLFDSKPDVDHYELRKLNNQKGSWESLTFDHDLGDVDDLDEPLARDNVENTAEIEGWPPGRYQIQPKLVDGTFGSAVWDEALMIEGDEDAVEEELDPQEEILLELREMRRERQEDSLGLVSDPDEAMGVLFTQALENDHVSWSELREFARDWRGPPTDPNEFAGAMVQGQLENGNQEAAAALLNNWMGSRGGGGDSLMDLATSLDSDDLNMDSIKALGMIKFLDDPASMTRDVASGMLQADAGAAGAGSGGGVVDGLFDQVGGSADQEAAETVETAEPVDEGPAPAADVDEPAGEPGVDPGASAADFDVAVDPEESVDETAAEADAEPAEVGVGTDAGAAAFEDETPASAAPAETEIEPDDAAAPDGGADSFDKVKEELEDRADAGDPASADEAMERMSEAAGDEGGED